MMKERVLFVCVHNTARSPMAQAFLREMCGDRFDVWSAGITAGELNRLAVDAMREVGIDISNHQTGSVFDLVKRGIGFQYVISLCDEAAGERCPTVPGFAQRLEWNFEDPALLLDALSEEARLHRMRRVRDEIRAAVAEWCSEVCTSA